jgi:hypothetical protein
MGPTDLLRALELLALEREQRLVLIQAREGGSICIKSVVIVISEGLRAAPIARRVIAQVLAAMSGTKAGPFLALDHTSAPHTLATASGSAAIFAFMWRCGLVRGARKTTASWIVPAAPLERGVPAACPAWQSAHV